VPLWLAVAEQVTRMTTGEALVAVVQGWFFYKFMVMYLVPVQYRPTARMVLTATIPVHLLVTMLEKMALAVVALEGPFLFVLLVLFRVLPFRPMEEMAVIIL
jgi:hypothetical protein